MKLPNMTTTTQPEDMISDGIPEEFRNLAERYKDRKVEYDQYELVIDDWILIKNPWNGCFDFYILDWFGKPIQPFKQYPEDMLHQLIDCHE